jgi:hypothetical protein
MLRQAGGQQCPSLNCNCAALTLCVHILSASVLPTNSQHTPLPSLPPALMCKRELHVRLNPEQNTVSVGGRVEQRKALLELRDTTDLLKDSGFREFGGAAFLSWTPGRRNHSRGLDDGTCRPPSRYREEGPSRRTHDSDTKSTTNLDHEVRMTNYR